LKPLEKVPDLTSQTQGSAKIFSNKKSVPTRQSLPHGTSVTLENVYNSSKQLVPNLATNSTP